MRKIKIGVADDHPVVLLGVTSALVDCQDIEILFTIDNIGGLITQIAERPVDVLLCDYQFEGDAQADGLRLLERIQYVAPETKVLFFSSFATPDIVAGALEAGAAGFVGKHSADFSSLATAIRNAHCQQVYLTPSLAGTILASVFGRGKHIGGLTDLSEREATVARLICDGFTIGQIAERMGRSPKTISNQKNAAMKKLGARNDVDLARIMRSVSR
ncbi:two-component system response regulator [Burkholderia ubonensis]|uniref:response regulator transcription factor n=1 Tax=Burkholderia ubonensis TaxID=101571 RepID=UPI000759CBAC|nr:response regulator transcription factor [Burkholderia ubonensis]KWB72610.1 two-component system response regulator [Burkholderia ubonensis]